MACVSEGQTRRAIDECDVRLTGAAAAQSPWRFRWLLLRKLSELLAGKPNVEPLSCALVGNQGTV
jgi:hypothetical protein